VDHPCAAAFVCALNREDLSPLTIRGYARDIALFLGWHAPNKRGFRQQRCVIPLAAFLRPHGRASGYTVERDDGRRV